MPVSIYVDSQVGIQETGRDAGDKKVRNQGNRDTNGTGDLLPRNEFLTQPIIRGVVVDRCDLEYWRIPRIHDMTSASSRLVVLT